MSSTDPQIQIGMTPKFLGKVDTCRVLGGISVSFLDGEVRAGNINPQVIAGRVVFTPDEIERYAREEVPHWEPK